MKVAAVQISSTTEEQENLKQACHYLKIAKELSSDLVLLPENVLCHGSFEQIRSIAKTAAEWLEALAPFSIDNSLHIVWGGIPVQADNQLFNMALIIDSTGNLIAKYAKKHLFAVKGISTETDLYTPGTETVEFALAGWKISLAICFDIRFPEHFRQPDLILCSSAFSQPTGEAHWELLCRTRAIENQCFLAAANQHTTNPEPFPTFGHSMLIDPWGDILEKIDQGSGIITAEFDKTRLQEVRDKMPMERA